MPNAGWEGIGRGKTYEMIVFNRSFAIQMSNHQRKDCHAWPKYAAP
jgi:hypothetical protein